MTATGFQVAAQGASGSIDRKGKRSYTVPYDVFVADASDGPMIVLDYLRDNGVFIGSTYAVGNEHDVLAVCSGISAPNRASRSVKQWRCTASYAYADGREGETVDGGISENPEDWRWDMRFGAVAWQEPCWEAWNHTDMPKLGVAAKSGTPYTRDFETLGPIVNSAGIVLDPTLMRDEFDLVWQVTAFSRYYDSRVSQVQGYLNDGELVWHEHLVDNYGFRQRPNNDPFDHYVIKCTQAGAVSRVTTIGSNRIPYWEWSFEFRFRWPNWLDGVLDRGITARSAGGDPDGLGGQIGALPDAATPAMPIVDGLGRRVPEMVLFDGAGAPLEAGDINEEFGVYFYWRKEGKRQMEYADINNGFPFPFFTKK